MSFTSWIKNKTEAVKSACVDTYRQGITEVRTLPNKVIGNAKKAVTSAKSFIFGKKSTPPPRKSITETEWGKYLSKAEMKIYDERVENFCQGRESTPAQIRAFMKVQSLRDKALADKGQKKVSYHHQQLQADVSINQSRIRAEEAQQRAYSGGKTVLNFVSWGGADHLEKARNSVEQGKGLSVVGHATAGLGLTAVGVYFTVAEAGNIAYGGCKWLFRLGKGAITKAPGVILSAGKAAVKAVKNPKAALESAKVAGRALKGAVGEIMGKASTGLKNLATTKLTQLKQKYSSARTFLGGFKSLKTAKQTLKAASGKLAESTGRLLSNIRAHPQTYVLKAGATALGVEWASHAVSDFKKGHTGSGLLNTALTLTVPSIIKFTTPTLLASREKLSALASAEIKEFGHNILKKACHGISNACKRIIASFKTSKSMSILVYPKREIKAFFITRKTYGMAGGITSFTYKGKLPGTNGDPRRIQIPLLKNIDPFFSGDLVLKREAITSYPDGFSTHNPLSEYIASCLSELLPRSSRGAPAVVPPTLLMQITAEIKLPHGRNLPPGLYSAQKFIGGAQDGAKLYGQSHITSIPTRNLPGDFVEIYYLDHLCANPDASAAENLLIKIKEDGSWPGFAIDNAASLNLKWMERVIDWPYARTLDGKYIRCDSAFLNESLDYAQKAQKTLTNKAIDRLFKQLKSHPVLSERHYQDYLDELAKLLKKNRDSIPDKIKRAMKTGEGRGHQDPFLGTMPVGDSFLESYYWNR